MEQEEEQKIFQNLKKIYDRGNGYHTIKFPNGMILPGRWDMSKFLKFYDLPSDLSGKSIIDVGPGNGYFAMEFSKRGASKVVAMDVSSNLWNDDFNKLMKTNVEFVNKDIMSLDDSFEKFDFVFCSNMLLHIPDIYGAIKKLRMITKEKAILCTSIMNSRYLQNVAIARFVATTRTQKDTPTYWWKPNMAGFIHMAKTAGFNVVNEISKFEAERDDKGSSYLGVIHCYT